MGDPVIASDRFAMGVRYNRGFLTHVRVQPVVNELRRDQVVLLRRNPVRVATDAARFQPDVLVRHTCLCKILGRAVVVRRVIGRLARNDDNRDSTKVRQRAGRSRL